LYALSSNDTLGSIIAVLRTSDVETFRTEIQSFGAWAPLASMGLMLLHTFVVFPFELLAIANGLVFGTWGGIALTWSSLVLSAWLGYAVARFARPLVSRLVPGDRLSRVEAWAARRSALELATVRLVPVISFSLLNLALGMLRVPFWRFTWTTAVGILPLAVASTLFGRLLLLGVWGWAVAAVAVALVSYHLLRLRRKPTKKSPQGEEQADD